MPATYTPIRYPGGKSKLYPIIYRVIEENGLIGRTYAEAFAGGAGVAMKLLLKGDVSKVLINDFDRAIFCLWKAIVYQPEEMCSFIDSSGPTIDEWLSHRDTYCEQDMASDLDLAKATFFLNRTNVSGIIKGGVIGGLDQSGPYKIDARFGKETLKNKIRSIAKHANSIEVTNLDAEDFIETLEADETFAYFDPPYVQKGPELYENSFDERKHKSLAKKISECKCKWLVTYDTNDLIESLYSNFDINEIDIRYSAYSSRIGREKIIVGPNVKAKALKSA